MGSMIIAVSGIDARGCHQPFEAFKRVFERSVAKRSLSGFWLAADGYQRISMRHDEIASPISSGESSCTKWRPATVTSVWFFHVRQNAL